MTPRRKELDETDIFLRNLERDPPSVGLALPQLFDSIPRSALIHDDVRDALIVFRHADDCVFLSTSPATVKHVEPHGHSFVDDVLKQDDIRTGGSRTADKVVFEEWMLPVAPEDRSDEFEENLQTVLDGNTNQGKERIRKTTSGETVHVRRLGPRPTVDFTGTAREPGSVRPGREGNQTPRPGQRTGSAGPREPRRSCLIRSAAGQKP